MSRSPARIENDSRRRATAPGLVTLLGLYVAVSLAPLVLAWALSYPPRTFWDELSSALAIMAFAGLLVEFVLSGRFPLVSGRVGIDATMRFHQLMARSLTLFILVHPFLYSTGIQNYPMPDDATRHSTLGLTSDTLATGFVGWIALLVLVVFAIFRNQSGWTYEAWRLSHGIAAVIFALFATHHTIYAGRYSGNSILAAYWLALLFVALSTMAWVYLITPMRQLRHPYKVLSVRPVALKTWELAIEPEQGKAIQFEPGQFVWLTLDRSPFEITEHPFSISSSQAMRPRIEFLIKEAGDATNRIGQVRVGAKAYLDGPHGALTLEGRQGSGIVLIAGGVGIAPLMSILRQVAADSDDRPVQLIYGNRLEEQIAYLDELKSLQGQMRFDIELVLSEPPDGWRGRTGRLDRPTLDSCIPGDQRQCKLYFVCGPAALIDIVEQALVSLGIPRRQIVSEKFSYD
jgi:predicted ferric reductase